jgi:hypothetical protein
MLIAVIVAALTMQSSGAPAQGAERGPRAPASDRAGVWGGAPREANDARQVSLSEPRVVADVDTGKIKGDIVRLAWSPDGSEFYVLSVERDGRGAVKTGHHYLIQSANKSLKSIDQEPPWAASYWTWKSGQASPAAPSFKIAVDSEQKAVRSTAAPMGGALAKGGTPDPSAGTSLADVASAAEQTQMQQVYTLKIRNETIGAWTNEPVMPGVNFSWAPPPLRLLVFAKREGGPLAVIDETGRKQELKGAKAALVPAWSGDGKQIAWLERKDKKKLELTVADVATAQ